MKKHIVAFDEFNAFLMNNSVNFFKKNSISMYSIVNKQICNIINLLN